MTPTTIEPSEKPQTINLDCSTRPRIVIRPKLPTPKRPIGRTVSIFNLMNLSSKPSPMPLETPVQSLVQGPLPRLTDNPSQHPPPLTPKMPAKSKTIEDSKIKKQRIPSTSSFPHPLPTTVVFPERIQRKIIPIPSRLHISSISSSTTPTPEPEPVNLTPLSILPTQPTSQYTEEYEKCPCTKRRANGRSPCDRCQLMLLADRFCELIDIQLHKWGIPHKH